MNTDYLDQKICWTSPFYEHTGYSYISRRFVKELLKRNWDMMPEPMRCNMEVDPSEIDFFESKRFYNPNGTKGLYLGPDAVKVVCWLPLNSIPQFKHNVIYTMMESRGVSPIFVAQCNSFYNSCWAPTQYYKDALKKWPKDIYLKTN